MNKNLRSPLRYPGGKQKDIPFLSRVIEQFQKVHQIREFRDPFLGGGSVLLYAVSNISAEIYWGNDAHPLLMDFWLQTQEDVDSLCKKVIELRDDYRGPQRKSPQWTKFRIKYIKKLNELPNDQLHNAARFFILNRSTSSGTTESGGLTPLAYCKRFTDSSIERLRALKGDLNQIKFTCQDYSELLHQSGENVFIYLDPPYLSAEKSRLYGKAGALHKGFNHELLAAELHNCNHYWLMTIDNSPDIRSLYSWAHIYPWEKAYSMTNIKGRKSREGKELLIANFKIASAELSDLNATSTVVFPKTEQVDPKNLKSHSLSLEIYGNQDVSDILHSILTKGFFQNQPILVSQKGRSLQIVSGHRRCKAAIEAGLNVVPIMRLSREFSPLEIESRVLDENLHRAKDGIQLIREFEHRKRIENKKAANQQVKSYSKNSPNGKVASNNLYDSPEQIAANTLGYSEIELTNASKALSIANRLKNENYQEEAKEIFQLIRSKRFAIAWERSQQIDSAINPDIIQTKLFPEFSQKPCYLKGLADKDAEKIISQYGHNSRYLLELVCLLEKHIHITGKN